MSPTDQRVSDDTAEFRVNTSDDLSEVKYRIQNMEAQHVALKVAVDDNTKITAEIKKNTDDIVEFFEAGRGTFKVLRMIGTAAKWITSVSAAIAVTWLMWKSGNK